MKVAALISSVLLLILLGCQDGSKKPAASFSKLPSSTDIYPLANGTALAVTYGHEKTVYLLSANQSVKVTGVPTDPGFPDAYPLADGSAYIVYTGSSGLRIYHLEGHSLVPVHETDQLTISPAPATAVGFAWADRISAQTRKARNEELERQSQTE